MRALADKYDFDAEEAIADLGNLKVKKQRAPRKPKEATRDASPPADKPKRAKTGYLLHQDHVRDECRAELEAEVEEGVKVMAKDVVRASAARWSALTHEEKEEWNASARSMAEWASLDARLPPDMSTC